MAARTLSILALLVALATPSAVSSAPLSTGSEPTEQPKVAPAPPPGSIPIPEVARRAEEVGKLLRDLDALLTPGPAIEAISKQLPEMAARIAAQAEETGREVDAEPAAQILDGLAAQWQTSRGTLVGYVNVLAARATALEGALDRLTGIRDAWTRARADAQASRAPAQVTQRINGVLTDVGASRVRLQEQRAATLVLQDRVAHEVARCDGVLGRIVTARKVAAGPLLERDAVPIWQRDQLAGAVTELPERVRGAVAADVAQLRRFAWDQRWRLPLPVALFFGLVVLMRRARRKAHLWVSPDDPAAAAIRVFDRPVSAALVFTVLASTWVYSSPPPRAVVALLQVLVLVPAVRVMRLLLDPSLVLGLYILGVFFLADLLRHFGSVVPLLERQIFLLEMLIGIAVLAWMRASGRRRASVAGAATRLRLLLVAGDVFLVVFPIALVAGAAGYMRLALLLGAGVLGSGYVALVLYAGLRVGDGLVAFALRVRPLAGLGMVRRRRPHLERRAHGLLRCLAIGAWVIFSLRYFALWNPAMDLAEAALGAEVRRGSLSVSLTDVLVFALTVWVAFLLSGLVRFVLEEEVYPRLGLGRGLPSALSGLVHYTLLLAGFLVALAAVGVDLTKVTILAGAFGVGIGFGLQSVVNNFVSGLLILLERRIGVGDVVQIGEVAGRVQQMGMRACTVRTWEGAEVIVPNASLTADKVTNWTLSDRRRRVDVGVGVAYGTAPKQVLDLLLAVARAHPLVLSDPAPVALFLGFGDSALRFEMRVWTDRFDLWVQTQSELAVALYAALQEAGIEIPFPQREVRLRPG